MHENDWTYAQPREGSRRFGFNCLYSGLVDLTYIAFGAHTLALPISLQSYSALILRPRLFDFNCLWRSYSRLADLASKWMIAFWQLAKETC